MDQYGIIACHPIDRSKFLKVETHRCRKKEDNLDSNRSQHRSYHAAVIFVLETKNRFWIDFVDFVRTANMKWSTRRTWI